MIYTPNVISTNGSPEKAPTPHPEILLVPADLHQIACNGQPQAAGAHVVPGGGHPKVYFSFDGRDEVVCSYCDRLFTKQPRDGAVPYAPK